jgi:hypothetical protein
MMTKEEIDKFWEGVERTAALVDTWPSWKLGGNKDDPRFAEWCRCDGCAWPVKVSIKIGKLAVCKVCEAWALRKTFMPESIE